MRPLGLTPEETAERIEGKRSVNPPSVVAGWPLGLGDVLNRSFSMKPSATPQPEEIVQILADYERSGMTQAEFVAQRGLVMSTFELWRRKARQRKARPCQLLQSKASPTSTSFIEVFASQQAGQCFEVSFPHGITLRIPQGFDPLSLQALLDLLPANVSPSCSR